MLKASIAWSLKVSEQPEKVLEMVAHLEIVLLPLKELLTVGDLVLILQFFSFPPRFLFLIFVSPGCCSWSGGLEQNEPKG